MMMGIQAQDLRAYVIRPTLETLKLSSTAAENLLLGTIAQESQMGHYLHQIKGPALGIYQIEPATHHDVWKNYLCYHSALSERVFLCGQPQEQQLITNLSYATAIARIIYLRAPEALPEDDDLEGLAYYYKRYYNTPKGKATEADFIKNYKRYVINE